LERCDTPNKERNIFDNRINQKYVCIFYSVSIIIISDVIEIFFNETCPAFTISVVFLLFLFILPTTEIGEVQDWNVAVLQRKEQIFLG
jgi:hypothetical protein